MNATSLVIAAAIVVAVGTVVQDKKFDIKAAFAAAVVALFLSMLANVDEKLATLFAGAVLLTALYMYAVPISKKLGFTK